jgi:hypothetical protein
LPLNVRQWMAQKQVWTFLMIKEKQRTGSRRCSV